MRRTFLLCIVAVMLVLALSTLALGAPSAGVKEVVKHGQITSLEKLFHRAQKGVTDKEYVNPKATLKSKNTGKVIDVHTLTTTQLLEEKIFENGQKEKIYATTSFAVLNRGKFFSQPAHTAFADYNNLLCFSGDLSSLFAKSQGDDDWDSTGGIKGYSTIYYSEYEDHNDVKYLGLIGAEGGWINYDYPQVWITDRLVRLGQNGATMDGETFSAAEEHYPSSDTFDYDAPSSWDTEENAVTTMAYSSLGCNQKVDLEATDGSTWSFAFCNCIIH